MSQKAVSFIFFFILSTLSLDSDKILDNNLKINSYVIETTQARLKRFLGEPLDESVTVSSQCFCVTVDNRFILACGYWDKSFKTFSTDSGIVYSFIVPGESKKSARCFKSIIC